MNKRLLFVLNWKSNKTIAEAIDWLQIFQQEIEGVDLASKEIVLCPSFTALAACREYITQHNLPIALGAQNISAFPSGAYTGEVSAAQLKELVSYTIIGHSERIKYVHEDKALVEQKNQQAQQNALNAIVCVRNEDDLIAGDIFAVAYEPVSAISTFGGTAENPEEVKKVFENLSSKTRARLLYGGSVTKANVSSYPSIELLSGFLIGGASLDAKEFVALLKACE